MTEAESKTWEVLSRDPTYPYVKCRRVKHPEVCQIKRCVVWRQWVMRDWLKMQYNAGIITKEEFEERMDREKMDVVKPFQCDECAHRDMEYHEFPCAECARILNGEDDLFHPRGQSVIADGDTNRYCANITAIMKHQRDKGLKKYGVTLEENVTLSTQQRIEHAEEELIDALMYLEHLKAAAADELTANDYQRMAMRTAAGMDYSKAGENGLLLNGLMGLNGEAGECIDIMKKHIFQGHELDREHLIEELGDCAWYLAVSCEGLGVTLEEVLRGNVDKLMRRYPDGFDKERSIHRAGEPNTDEWGEIDADKEVDDALYAVDSAKAAPKTYEQDFLEKFPNAEFNGEAGYPVACRDVIYSDNKCGYCGDCNRCWNEVMPNE